MVYLYFDGGTINLDDGTFVAVCGAFISYENKLWQFSKVVGEGKLMTSNVAEYSGIIGVMKAYQSLVAKGLLDKSIPVRIRGDSKMVCFMVNGTYGKKRIHPNFPHLVEYVLEARQVFSQMPEGTEIQWVHRSKNQRADALCHRAINEYRKSHGLIINRKYSEAKTRNVLSVKTKPRPAKTFRRPTVADSAGYTPPGRYDPIGVDNHLPESTRAIFGDIIDVWNELEPKENVV